MKIAYFNANLRQGQDGVTRCVYKMIEGALERDHEAIAITSTLPEETPPIPMYRVPSVVLPLQKNYRIALPGYASFSHRLEEFKPDILHINSPCTLGFAAAKYGRQFGIPVVATYHTHFPTYPRYYRLQRFEDLAWRLTRNLYNNIDHTFVPTLPILEELQNQNIRGLEHLPNGVDTDLFTPARRSQEWRNRVGAGEKPVVLFVSRLVWEKDLRVLADTYKVLRDRQKNFVMVVVGDGSARAELESMMPGARFLGYQSGTALAESYASSDVFVFPSTTETFGLVTLEAMVSGVAPVAARVGGAAGIIEHAITGLLADPFNPRDLANRVELLLDRPDRRRSIGIHAHRYALQYSWKFILNRLFESYENIVERHRGGPATRRAA